MDGSCSQYLQLKQLSDIRYRIRYYLGPLYYKDKVYVDNLVLINYIEPKFGMASWENFHTHALKIILKKYGFINKKFIYKFGDIQEIVDRYALVKNRFKESYGKSVILRIFDYERHWNNFYNIKIYFPFENKLDKIFWRGSTTGELNRSGNRFTLVEKYFNKYNDIDIGFSNICQGKNNYKKYIKISASLKEFLKNKYLLSVEGNDKDSGLNWKLASNSLVLMAKPRAFSWLMEDMLIPNYHYVLLKDDFSDLREKLDWCNNHQPEVKQIIKNANEYMEMFCNIKQEEYIEKEVLRLYFEKIKGR